MAQDPAATRPPFAHLRASVAAAGLYALLAFAWVAGGAQLPGGRWFAVHLFTLGVLTNVVVAFTSHFAETLLRVPRRGRGVARVLLLNVGVVGVLAGLPLGVPAAVAAGGLTASAAVGWLYLDLRRARRSSVGARFGFVVGAYERAAGAFLHGALLGVLLGVGVLPGAWYGPARLAHLHLNVLGWGGLTLLATVVFFGPTMMRTRIVEGAEATSARALRYGATGLAAGSAGLLTSGLAGVAGSAARVLAVVGLAVFASGVTAVCSDVLRASRRANPSIYTSFVRASCAWFVAAAWLDVGAVASGRHRLLEAAGAVLLLGVLGQAILAATSYVAPMAWAAGGEARAMLRARLERLARLRSGASSLGVALVATAAAAGPAAGRPGSVAMTAGWGLLAGAVLAQALLPFLPHRRSSG